MPRDTRAIIGELQVVVGLRAALVDLVSVVLLGAPSSVACGTPPTPVAEAE